MALKPIYLEPDEEITSVIDKISALGDHQVAVVVPKNSALFQSLINVKLLAKEAKDHKKDIVLITANKVGQRLAAEVGLTAYSTLAGVGTNLKAQGTPEPASIEKGSVAEETSETVGGIKVNRYRPAEDGEGLVAAADKVAEAVPAVAAAEMAEKLPAEAADFTTTNLANGESDKKEDKKEPLKPEDSYPESHEQKPTKTEQLKDTPESTHHSGGRDADPEELPPIISRSGSFKESRQFHIPWLPLGIALGVILIVCLVVFFFVPRATVVATFPATSINKTLSLDVTTSGNNQDLTITGTKIASDKTVTETINSSGTKDVGTPATGTITITNEYKNSSGVGQDETLPAGTVIDDTNSGQTFALNNAVTIGRLTYNANTGQPIYQSENDTVTAASPGSSGNIAATTFSCATALSNTIIQSNTAFTGGVSNIVKVLTQSDIDGAMNDLKTQAVNQTTADLKSQAGKNVFISGSTWQIAQTQSVDHNVGDQTNTAIATYELNVGAIVFDPNKALNAIKGDLSDSLNTNQQLVLDNSNITETFSSLNDAKTDMTVSAAVQAYSVDIINESSIGHAIAGKSTTIAINTLENNYGANKVSVAFKPSWWPNRLPILSHFISLKYNYVQSK